METSLATNCKREGKTAAKRLIVLWLLFILLSVSFYLVRAQGFESGTSFETDQSQNASSFVQNSSYVIKNFTLPTANAGPNAIVSGSNGTLWFVEFSAGKIGEFFSYNESIREFSIPEKGAIPASLARDQFGTIWFSDQKIGSPSIWSFNPISRSFKQYPILTSGALPLFILIDPNHNVWFTETTGYKIGELAYPAYSMTEYPVPASQFEPLEMTLDQNKSTIWITLAQTTSELQPGELASFNITTGKFENVYTPTVSLQDPVGIVLDKDGNVWVSEHRGSSILEFNPSSLAWLKYQTSLPPASFQVGTISAPATLAIDKQGNLWFVEHFSNRVGTLNPLTGIIQEFQIPGPPGPYAYSVLNAIDQRGNFWFTNFVGNSIDMIPANATTNIISNVTQPDSKNQIPQVVAGQSVSVDLGIKNLAPETQEFSLNATSSFSSDGVTSSKEVSFNRTASPPLIQLASNRSAIIQLTVTPDNALASGIYSISLIASGENSSTIQTFFIRVNAGPFYFFYHLGDYFQYIVIAAIIIVAGLYLFFRRHVGTTSNLKGSDKNGGRKVPGKQAKTRRIPPRYFRRLDVL